MKRSKRILSFITAAAMAFAGIGALPDTGILPGLSVTASAEVLSGTYWKTEWNEAAKTVTGSSAAIPSETRVFNGTLEYYEEIGTDDLIEEELWYYVDKDTTVNERLNVRRHKTVNFSIKNGVTLTCNKGIEVARRDGDNDQDYYGGTLNIYGESATGGKLIARADDDNAAIGGRSGYFNGRINIYSGEVEATGGKYGAGIGSGDCSTVGWQGFVNIYGGKVTATGGESGAGIGAGNASLCQYVSIYGGTVVAQGGYQGAGIGLGEDCPGDGQGEVNIYGGTITSTGGQEAAGIGGGESSPGRNLHIYGGTVTAYAGEYAAGIGAGKNSGEFNITIDGGNVEARGNKGGPGIGGGYFKSATGTVVINGGKVYAFGGDIKSSTSQNENFYAGAGIGSASYSTLYSKSDFEGIVTITGGNVTARGGQDIAYGPTDLPEGDFGGAGIGSGAGTNMQGTINISGGTVTAEGGPDGAAIGAGGEVAFGGGGECEGTVNITGGDLTLEAHNGAVAVGHGANGDDNGTLHIDGKLAVTKGDETTPVSYLDRGKETRSNAKVHIFPCGHDASGKTYTINDDNGQTHTYFCSYCGHSDSEAHNMLYGVCTLCGYGSNGSCGETAYYALEDGKLTIKGIGDMYDYNTSDNKAPWYDDRESIKTVVIENGVSNIGAYSFYGFSALENLTLPDSVDIIGGNAFTGTKPYFIVTTTYLDENGKSKNVSGYAVTDSLSSDTRSIDWDTQDFSGYKYTFIVVDNVTVGTAAEGTTIWSEANTTLILCDGSSLTVNGYEKRHAISMDNWSYTNGKDLTIYGQSKGTGKLTAVPSSNQKTTRYGIHAGSVTINGGQVTVQKGIDAYTCLNWTSPNNFVKADFYNRSVSCTKPFVLEGTTTVLDPSNSYPANYKKLVPACTFTIKGEAAKAKTLNSDGTVTPPAVDEDAGFDGWYSSSDYSGEKFDFDEPITDAAAFYGRYIVSHTVTISDTANGTVTADKQTAAGGDTVTLTVTPDAGYSIGNVSVNDGAVTLTDNGSGTYTFTMPDADVTVSAVFEQLPKPKAKVTTAPTAKTGLTYTGKAQALITAGEADTSMEYSLDGTNYSETVPTGTNANIYTVYYRAAADATHNAGYAVQLTVSVSRRSLKVTGVTAARRVFNGYPIVNVTSVTLSGICGTDDVAVDTSNLTGELASADAGVYTSLTLPAGLALKGASEDNYTLIQPTAPVAADVTIDKAEPTINVTAAAYNKTYGDAPFVIVGVTPSTSLAAIGYEVTDGTDVISLTDTTVTILKTGTATITAYIPETINYTAASAVITVEVAKADSPKTKPQTEISVSESCTSVSDVELPSGWEWADEDKDKTLAGGVPVTAAAKYTGTDAECYNNTTVSVTITRASHTHTAGAAVHENVTASTCTTGGSYDKIIRCTECNEIISRTHCTTAPLGHTLGDPVYENEVIATCTGAGSGETAYYCAVCGTIMIRTSAMQPALGNNYISVVTTPATCSSAGVKTYTCSRCSDTYTEVIPKLDHTPGLPEKENEIAATCTSSGSYVEINYCTLCETEISRTTVTTPALGHTFESGVCIRCGAVEVKPGTLADLLENATGDKLILALVADESVTKLKFPKNVKEITIDGGGHTLDFTGAANIKPNQELTLANITINAEKNGKKQNITLTAATDGLVLENVTFDGKKTTITATKGGLTLDNVTAADLTVKGAAKTTLTIISDVSAATVSGFGNIKADGSLTVTKTLKANTLELSGNAVLNVVRGAAITLSKGISGSGTINLASGFKAITLNGAAAGRIRLTGDKMTDGQLIFKSKLTNLNDVFDISGIAPEVTDGEYEYGLYAKSGKVYLRAFKMQLGDTAYCEWADIMTDITKAGKGGEIYTVSLLGSVDLDKAFKLPTKGKYAGLTIDGNGNTLTYSGSSITLTGNLKLTNLTLNATAKNGCTIKQGSFTLDAGGAELVNCKVK